MDRNRFDGFTRQLAQRENRRQAIKTLLAGGVGTAAVVLVGNGADAKGKPGGTGKSDCCPATAPKLCGLTCTDVSNDELNCGACGTTCFSYQTCVNGVCTGESQCGAPKDCQPGANECQEAACDGGLCGFTNAPYGTPAMAQTPEDCKRNVCDGNGQIITISDAGDRPQEIAECFQWVCSDDGPVKVDAPPDFPCTGGTCNGAGACIQCAVAADCPAPDNECKIRTCTSGTCGFDFVAAGTPVTAQTAGDCHRDVCDGGGNVTSEIDDSDTPAPSGDCVTGVCTSGVPSQPAKSSGELCSVGVCDGRGTCVECVSPINCFEPDNAQATCNANMCGFTCDSGFGSCDEDGPVGCGTNFNTDTSNCGGCGQNCGSSNGIAACISGTCEITCFNGYTNCDGVNASGCETNTGADVNNCGGCGQSCGSNNGTPSCVNSTCMIQCNTGFADCNGSTVDGCEVNILNDANNCGSCGNQCNIPHATSMCVNGRCEVAACEQGWGNCNVLGQDGCEIDFMTDNANCGSCSRVCIGTTCEGGVCR